MTLNEVMKDTADAIREKTGKSDLIAPVNFATEIKGITAGGGGGADSNLEYLDVRGLDVNYEFELLDLLLQVSIYNKDFYYEEESDMYEYQIVSTNTRWSWGINLTTAVALDLSLPIVLIYDGDFEDSEPINLEISTKDFLIMMLEEIGYDNAAEVLDSIPRISKEEFFAIPEKPKKPFIGGWIQHVDGTLYTGDQWTAKGFSNDKANGVAMIDEGAGVSLVVAKDKFGPMPWSSMPDTLIEGIFTTTDINERDKVYCGAEDTAIIAAADPDSAAAACMNYTFPNGQKGYLMSVGEGNTIYAEQFIIQPLMQRLGETWEGDYAWSCVQHDASNAYCVRLAGLTDSYADAKLSKYIVRPVCTLENYTFAE